MSESQTYLNALKVSLQLGTWVLYAVRDARDLDHLIGYMAYTVDDLSVEQTRAKTPDKQKRTQQLIGFWRRAIRFVSELPRDDYAVVAERLINRINEHPENRKMPFCVAFNGHRTLNTASRPPRRAGRPRVRSSEAKPLADCVTCLGLGFIRTDQRAS